MSNNIEIYSSRFTEKLAKRVIDAINAHRADDEILSTLEPMSLGDCKIEEFNNGEITVQYKNSIRNKEVYIFGHTGTHEIMELALMMDAAKRAAAGKIIAVVPSYGYARQDKKEGKRGPMGAKLVADILSAAGGDKFGGIITVDLHADAIQGFFDTPVNHINGFAIFREKLKELIGNNENDYVICSPDAGGFIRASRFAKKLGLGGAVAINKERDKPGSISKMTLVGDFTGKHIILVDDMFDTAGTICKAANYLVEEKNVASVIAVGTHGIFSPPAFTNLFGTKNLQKLLVSDTIDFENSFLKFKNLTNHEISGSTNYNKIEIVSCATILARIIGRISKGKSMDIVNEGIES